MGGIGPLPSIPWISATESLNHPSNPWSEVITLAIFVPFAMLYMGEGLKWNYLWAGLCLVGAVYFIFRS